MSLISLQFTEGQSPTFLTYTNNTLAFKIQYPNDWKLVPPSSQSSSGGIIFESPSKSASFRVLVEQTNKTFEEWSSDYFHFLDSIVGMSNTLSKITNEPGMRETLDSQKITLAGIPAWQAAIGNSTYIRNDMWTVKGNYAYILKSQADSIDMEVYLPTFAKMWNSFQIIN
jgi:hypothetical protein